MHSWDTNEGGSSDAKHQWILHISAVVAGGEFEYFSLSKMVLEVMIFKDLNWGPTALTLLWKCKFSFLLSWLYLCCGTLISCFQESLVLIYNSRKSIHYSVFCLNEKKSTEENDRFLFFFFPNNYFLMVIKLFS